MKAPIFITNSKVFYATSILFSFLIIIFVTLFSINQYSRLRSETFENKVIMYTSIVIPGGEGSITMLQRLLIEDFNKKDLVLMVTDKSGNVLIENLNTGSIKPKHDIKIVVGGYDYLTLSYGIIWSELIKNYFLENGLIYLVLVLLFLGLVFYILFTNKWLEWRFIEATKLLSKQTSEHQIKHLSEVEKNYFGSKFTKLFEDLNEMIERLLKNEKDLSYQRQKLALADQAFFISHDLRSPLTALSTVINLLPNDDFLELKELLKSSYRKIFDLTENLLCHKRKLEQTTENPVTDKKLTFEELKECTLQMLSEYKKSYPTLTVETFFSSDADNAAIFKEASRLDFERILSNLLNNSIDAAKNDLKIKVKLTVSNQKFSLKIIDNGQGVPKNVLNRFKDRTFSFGKVNGNGLGLKQVKSFLDQQNFRMKFNSKLNMGTIITIFN